MKKICSAVIICVIFSGFLSGCAAPALKPSVHEKTVSGQLHAGTIILQVCRAIQVQTEDNSTILTEYPPYLEKLLADGRLTVGIGVGTSDLAKGKVSPDESGLISKSEQVIQNKKILIESRLILSRADFQKALHECEIIFIAAHSRFGAGPAFFKDGKSKPYRMQRTPGYEISMPENEVEGYPGKVIRTYAGFMNQKKYFDFEPDSRDLDLAVPYPGYQLLVFSTCSSGKHFLDEVEWLRQGYPTTAVFTTGSCGVDPMFRPFRRMLASILTGKGIYQVVKDMNSEYRSVAWENVKKKNPPWCVVEKMYRIGIHHIDE